jgi:hypothetical protein
MPSPEPSLPPSPLPALAETAPPAVSPPRRKRGAQPNNHNALKHGFYARNFSVSERHDLADCPVSDPLSEAAMIRVLQRRLFELSESVEDFASLRLLLNTLARSAYTIDRLIRTSAAFNGKANPFSALLVQAVEGTLDDLEIHPPQRS